MSKEELVRILRPITNSIKPTDERNLFVAASRAIDPGGTINRNAAKDLMPMQTLILYADKPLEHAAGPDNTQAIVFPQKGRIVRLDARLRAAESGYTFSATISINGTTYKTISMASGVTSYTTGDNRSVAAGDSMTMGVNVVSVARGLTICVHWIPDIT